MNQPQNITFDVPNAFELEKLSELHKAMGDFTRTKINSMHSGLQN